MPSWQILSPFWVHTIPHHFLILDPHSTPNSFPACYSTFCLSCSIFCQHLLRLSWNTNNSVKIDGLNNTFRKGFTLCTHKALLLCNPFNKIIAANIYVSWNELLPNQWYVELNKLTLNLWKLVWNDIRFQLERLFLKMKCFSVCPVSRLFFPTYWLCPMLYTGCTVYV